MYKMLILSLLVSISTLLQGQQEESLINPRFLHEYWDASWITHPVANLEEYGVYHFRKSFDLPQKPGKFIVHVSADNRYRLFVNGEPACFGPARGDIRHWYFETIDIAPFLKEGRNILSAVVWNFGNDAPVAQMSRKTAFILQGNSDLEKLVNTNASWKVMQNLAYHPVGSGASNLGEYIVVGPGDQVDGNTYPWNWQNLSFDDADWSAARELEKGRARGLGTGTSWDLIPREIPFMEESILRFSSVRRAEGIVVDESFLKGTGKLTVPAHAQVTILLDQGYETVAYPEITVSGSQGSEIELQYAEALYDAKGNKGNRNDVEGKKMKGNKDIFKVGSAPIQMFRPLWFRTFRYVQMTIKTNENPLVINNLQSVFTAYPFKENASFTCDDPEVNKIWEVGWRTLRLCSNETHYDCPYYEQLQYIGDTRIQCLISTYVSGDDRLTRQAIQAFDRSRFNEGLTTSRYPSNDMQVIPPFSLFWTNMIHDYWMHFRDTTFVQSMLFGIENVLHWYEERIDPKTGMLGATPYWNFVDWPKEWPWSMVVNSGGVPAGGAEGGSSILSFQLAYALNQAAELFSYFGEEEKAAGYQKLAGRICNATIKLCWDSNRKLFADTPGKIEYSQHANIMAILSGANLPVDPKELINRVAKDDQLIQATFYYRFYLMQAMKKAGLAEQYVAMLEPWRNMLSNGLTTFAEKPEPTRSDCHAWSASPDYDLLATVCGIEPASPGFGSVKIEPHLGTLRWVEASMPHAKGMIRVQFSKNENGGLEGEIEMPSRLQGTFIYAGKRIELKEGSNRIKQ